MENRDVADWLEISKALFLNLRPAGSGMELFGHDLAPAEFAALVDRETDRVDHALTAMATASGEVEVRAIFGQLSPDTLIALCSRWARYLELWKGSLRDPDQPWWFPANKNDWWRAVLLSMTSEGLHSTDAARSLWPGAF